MKIRYSIITTVALCILILTGCSSNAKTKHSSVDKELPIIYSAKYNISIMGIENLHPFDTKKYKRVVKYLNKNCGISKKQLLKPRFVTEEELLLVHSPAYLETLKKSSTVAKIAEIHPLKLLPNFILDNGLLKPMRLATGGTIMGVHKALEYGWAINLSGGYHHAKAESGEGFSVYADIPIAVRSIWKTNPDLNVLVIDLDAHQGNGVSSILGDDERIAILDIYNYQNYPNDVPAKDLVTYNVPIPANTKNKEYLEAVRTWTTKAIEEHSPDLIIYNAGTDIYDLDPLGRLSVTRQGVIERDEIIFSKAKESETPILMVLSGGYHKESGNIIAQSIENLLDIVIEE